MDHAGVKQTTNGQVIHLVFYKSILHLMQELAKAHI